MVMDRKTEAYIVRAMMMMPSIEDFQVSSRPTQTCHFRLTSLAHHNYYTDNGIMWIFYVKVVYARRNESKNHDIENYICHRHYTLMLRCHTLPRKIDHEHNEIIFLYQKEEKTEAN